MSRHKIIGYDSEHDITVGWDSGLATYFVQVFPYSEREGEDYREELLWTGTYPGEIPNIEQLKNVIREFAEIPIEVEMALCGDIKKEKIGSIFLDSITMKTPQ